jgi:hypothetical protein
LVNHATFQRVQSLLGCKTHRARELLYVGLIRCAHCGNVITGEAIIKKQTGKQSIFHRCTSRA